MPTSIKDDVIRNGYAFIPEYYSGTDISKVASMLGTTLTPWKDGLIQELVPRAIATPNTYSGMYGLGCFPFHTDLAHWSRPPRYLLLRCMTGYADVTTRLLDGHLIFNTVTLDILTRAIFKPRRPRKGAYPLLRLCEPIEGGYCLRWDEAFLTPASKVGDIACKLIKEQLNTCAPLSIALVKKGDTLLIDNWRMLHARSLIPVGRADRRIQRIYLEELN